MHRAPIAQLVELRTFNPQVPGSSPGGGTAQMFKSGRCLRLWRVTGCTHRRSHVRTASPGEQKAQRAATSPGTFDVPMEPSACYRVLASRYPRIIGTAHTTTIPTDHSNIPVAGVSTGPLSDNPRMASTA